MGSPTLFVDADILAYKTASIHQDEFEFDFGEPIVSTNMEGALDYVSDKVGELQDLFETTKVVMCLSDDKRNWRKSVLPSYKAARGVVVRPQLLYPLKEYLFTHYQSVRWPRLEADDVMGILQTNPKRGGLGIIVSDDKDMRTIPGTLYHPAWVGRPKDELLEVSAEEARYNHLLQTLMGDTTDGYKGCPGIGPVKAKALLDEFPTWDAVRLQYACKGIPEKQALQQARVAYILQWENYNIQQHRIRLWSPPSN